MIAMPMLAHAPYATMPMPFAMPMPMLKQRSLVAYLCEVSSLYRGFFISLVACKIPSPGE